MFLGSAKLFDSDLHRIPRGAQNDNDFLVIGLNQMA